MAFLSRRILLRSGLAAGGLVAAGLGGAGTAYAETGDTQSGDGQGFDPLGGETDGRRRRWRPVAEDVHAELRRAWRAYKRFAWGHDELHPLTNSFGEFFDDARPVGLTIVEALDTLYLMGLDDELEDGVDWIRDHLDFAAVAQPVQVFETNIRMVGGLLSGYLAPRERVL